MKLDKETFCRLTEKEELINFMVDAAPFLPFRRVNNGHNKGAYEAFVSDDIGIDLDVVSSSWKFGKADYREVTDENILRKNLHLAYWEKIPKDTKYYIFTLWFSPGYRKAFAGRLEEAV